MRHIELILASVRRAAGDRKGVTAVEYAVIGALIIVAAIGAIEATGGGVTGAFDTIAAALPAGGG